MKTRYQVLILFAVVSIFVFGIFESQALETSPSYSEAGVIPDCEEDQIPMKNPVSGTIDCVKKDMIETYLDEGFVYIKTTKGQGTVPDWIKNTATWYGDGSVSQTEFVDAIKHLVDNKVIKLSDTENIKKNILKSKHQVAITDLRFLQCVDLHDEFIKMGQDEFHNQFVHKPFLNICVNFYKDPVWASAYSNDPQELYKSFQEYASTGVDKSNFQQCMLIHRFYGQVTESQFRSQNADKDYIDDCITLYKDPIWQYDEKDRMKQLYSRFVEIESSRTGQPTPSHTVHSEISYVEDLGDGVFEIQFNACAGDTVIHHAKFLIKSSFDSIEIGSYKDLQPNSCRTYSATIHAENSNDIEVHLMESVEKEHVETKEDIKPLSCAPGWEKKISADGMAVCKAKPISQLVTPTPGGVGG